jgi:hypothetical protein
MNVTTDGGMMTLQTQRHGLWEVRIPWEVALDGWREESGGEEPGQSELIDWMDLNATRFADMVIARVDERLPRRETDDPRVIGVRL